MAYVIFKTAHNYYLYFTLPYFTIFTQIIPLPFLHNKMFPGNPSIKKIFETYSAIGSSIAFHVSNYHTNRKHCIYWAQLIENVPMSALKTTKMQIQPKSFICAYSKQLTKWQNGGESNRRIDGEIEVRQSDNNRIS